MNNRKVTGQGIRSKTPPLSNGASSSSAALKTDWQSLGKFLGITLQVGLLVLLMRQFHIESRVFYEDVALLTLVGFIIHHFLPAQFKLPFFLLVSVAAIWLVMGVVSGAWLIGIGLLLIGITHLPIRFSFRVVVIVIISGMLAYFRVYREDAPWPDAMLPILGAIFMFRLIVYLYDMKHDNPQVSVWHKLSYFFLLPNVCFPLFPVVDYKTFCRTYYDRDAFHIYQKGVQWIFRGVVHLILYRLVYYHLTLSPVHVADVGTLMQFIVSNFLLYLRISGQFHLIVGILCLFGFNLPETHHLYYLSSSFNDYWRRINIYWKDFMMKIVYYPMFFKLRKWGTTTGIVLATVLVFFTTWILHSYQWFWLRGSFPLHPQDSFFWGIFGLLVIANSLYEIKHGRKRTLGAKEWSLANAIKVTLKTISVFLAICLLWSFWTSNSVSEWVGMWSFLREKNWANGSGVVLGILAATVGIGVVSQYLLDRMKKASAVKAEPAFSRVAAVSITPLLALLILGNPSVYNVLGPEFTDVANSLHQNRLSKRDVALLQRGYYEGLLGVDRFNTQLWEVYMKKPNYWKDIWQTDASHLTHDFLKRELKPLVKIPFKGATLTTNRWGMRDRDYEKQKPPQTYRIAVLGASQVMGAGVEDNETFENLIEDRLNREYAKGRYKKYEILNFAVSGYSPLERMMSLEKKILDFQPDALFYVAHERDADKAVQHTVERIRSGIAVPYPYLQEIVRKAGITKEMPEVEASRRLSPYRSEITGWVYRRIVDICRKNNIIPVWIFRPSVEQELKMKKVKELFRLARAANFIIIDLTDVYQKEDIPSLWLTEWDHHPNAKGHKLLADRLYQEMLRENQVLQLGLNDTTGDPTTATQ